MVEKIIGDIRFFCDGHGLNIGPKVKSGAKEPLSLNVDGVKKLSRFLTNLLETCLNTRHSFRVQLWDDAGVKGFVRHGGERIPVTPKNLSMTGVMVEYNPDCILNVKHGETIEVGLLYEDTKIIQPAEVRRIEPQGYGLFFKNSVKNEQINPPDEYKELIMDLQRRWLQMRRAEV